MATINVTIGCNNTQGSTNFRVRYRLQGASIWSSYLIAASGSTSTSFQGQNNYIYDVQIQNLNGADNPLSLISQIIGFSDPLPLLYPTNISLGYSFGNQSPDIDTYVCSIALQSAPGALLQSHILTPGSYPLQITDTFTGLTAATAYVLFITPTANQFANTTFSYNFITESRASCPDVSNLTVTLTYP